MCLHIFVTFFLFHFCISLSLDNLWNYRFFWTESKIGVSISWIECNMMSTVHNYRIKVCLIAWSAGKYFFFFFLNKNVLSSLAPCAPKKLLVFLIVILKLDESDLTENCSTGSATLISTTPFYVLSSKTQTNKTIIKTPPPHTPHECFKHFKMQSVLGGTAEGKRTMKQ